MFVQRALDNSSQEVINLAREQSAELMRQIFETLSEGVIKFSWKQAASKAELHQDDFKVLCNEHE